MTKVSEAIFPLKLVLETTASIITDCRKRHEKSFPSAQGYQPAVTLSPTTWHCPPTGAAR